MATELNEKVGLTKAARDNIKQALYNKTGVTQSDDIRTYANVIANIPTGIDTSDATAAANSIIWGKTAYVNGIKITGNMYDIGPNTNGHSHGYTGIAGATASRTIDYTNSYIKYRMTQSSPNPIVYTQGAFDEIWENFTNLANVINLTPNILQKNKTVLGITGTLESLDTTDATANSYDIALGQTAYVNGQKLTGNVTTINNGINTYCSNNSILTDIPALNRIQTKCTFSNNIMFREGSELMIDVPYSNFISVNNLTADNIKSGVNLLGVIGNYSGSISTDTIPEYIKFINANFFNAPYYNNLGIDCSYMFYNCTNLYNVPNYNTSLTRDMSYMFYRCTSLGNLSLYDTSNTINMSYMLCGSYIYEVPNFNTINVTDMSYMLSGMEYLHYMPNFDTSNVINMQGMLLGTQLSNDIIQLNTCNVKDLSKAFTGMYFTNTTKSIQNIINMCLNSNIPSYMRNLKTSNQYSPIYDTEYDSSYYSNRLSELTAAGWSY